MGEQALSGKRKKCLQRYPTRAFQGFGVVVHQGKYAETQSLESPNRPVEGLDR